MTDATTAPPDEIKLTEAQITALLKQVQRHRDESLSNRQHFVIRSEDRYRRYLADITTRPQGPWPEAPRLFMPYTRDALERIQGQYFKALFGNASLDTMSFEPFGEEDVDKAKQATRFSRFTLHKAINHDEDGGFPYIANMALFDALMDGAGVLKCYWWMAPWRLPPMADPRRWLSEYVRIDNVDQGRLLVPSDAEGFQYPECRYVHQELWYTPDDLMRLKARGYEVPDKDQFTHSLKDVDERRRAEQERDGQTVDLTDQEGAWLVESYERFPVEGKLEDDVIVSWFPDAKADKAFARIRRLTDVFPAMDRPRRPFFRLSVWPQPRQWRGLNIPDRLESPQDILNRIAEQAVNYGDLSLTPWIFYNALLTGDLPDLRQVRPGTPIPVNSLDGVQWFTRPPVSRYFQELSQFFAAVIERDSGVSDMSLGRQSDRPNQPRTAAGTAMILQSGREGFSYSTSLLKGQFEGLLNFHFQLWQSRIPPGFHARIKELPRQVGDLAPEAQQQIQMALVETMQGNGTAAGLPALLDRLFLFGAPPTPERLVARSISKEDLSGFFDAHLEINPDAVFEQQILVMLAEKLSTIPQLVQYPLGLRELWKRVWEASGQRGFEQIWPARVAQLQSAAIVQALEAQQQAMQAQAAAAEQAQGQQTAIAEQQQAAQAQDAALTQAQQGARVQTEQARAAQAQTQADAAPMHEGIAVVEELARVMQSLNQGEEGKA